MIARVLQTGGGTYRVRAGGREFDCSLRGRIKLDGGSPVTVGDRVEVEELDDGSCRIVGVEPRHSALIRRAVARRADQVMAANVDQVAAVVSAARPDPDLLMLDRLLAVAEFDELGAFVVLNKVDLQEDQNGSDRSDLTAYEDMGYDVLPTSVADHTGIEALRDRLAGRITVLAGASGVGKSSLLNALDPGLDLRVGDVGERSGRGRHTTTSARLIPLDDDTYIADTPGIQNFVPAGLEAATLGHAFREFRPWLESCKFADCKHREEPGCAILAAVEDGDILQRRYESYLALLEAAEAGEEEARTGGSRSRG
ncbi:MAG TPA: ribosome small subunit-dependent GTPase A [Gemmatimonadota bacterium]|nr:ribosome small subunit-dependent GTPase A [Gemmatimonadota bacterium]